MAVLCFAATSTTTFAQNLNSAYFTKDFKYRHVLNPAMENDQNYFALPFLGHVNFGAHSDFAIKDVIMDNPMYPHSSEHRLTTFMNPYISVDDALKGFNKGDNKFVQNLDLAILSTGFKSFGGYSTIELNLRQSLGLSLPYELFEFAKNTGNKVYEIGDINASAQAFAELAFGHSRQINDQLRLGAKVKFLIGAGRVDLAMNDMRADLSGANQWSLSGKAEANVSLKGLQYISETKEYKEEGRGTYQQITDLDVDGAGIGGFGVAFDLGAVYKINDDWTVSASLLDLGMISWSNNLLAASSGKDFVFDGFHDVTVKGDGKLSNKTDKLGDQFSDFAHLSDQGDTGGRSTGIGATMNLGAEYTLPSYRQMKFGALLTSRINGEYSWTEGRLSANWEPLQWIDGGVSFAASNFGASMGWVVNIHPKAFNFFIGMDHLLTSCSSEGLPLGSNNSISVGMNIAW